MESCTTLMMNPAPTTCTATLAGIPKSEQAMGIRSRDPPAIPEVPQAAMVLSKDSTMAERKSTRIPSVFVAASVMMVITTAAPSILMVAPSGMETE